MTSRRSSNDRKEASGLSSTSTDRNDASESVDRFGRMLPSSSWRRSP